MANVEEGTSLIEAGSVKNGGGNLEALYEEQKSQNE